MKAFRYILQKFNPSELSENIALKIKLVETKKGSGSFKAKKVFFTELWGVIQLDIFTGYDYCNSLNHYAVNVKVKNKHFKHLSPLNENELKYLIILLSKL